MSTVDVDANGVATLIVDSLSVGAHTINANYLGEIHASSSAQVDHQVDAPPDTSSTTTSTTTTPTTTTTTPTSTTSTTSTTTTTSTSLTTSTTAPGRSGTVTVLTSSANPSLFGQPVTFTATITPAQAGSGPVGFRSAPRQVSGGGTLTISDGTTVLATVAVEGGEASFTTSSLGVGTHTITAAFTGTATAASSSATIVQQVNQAATLPGTR